MTLYSRSTRSLKALLFLSLILSLTASPSSASRMMALATYQARCGQARRFSLSLASRHSVLWLAWCAVEQEELQ